MIIKWLADCSKEFRKVATEFGRKFARRTASSGKDAHLAEALERRLAECSKKSDSNHWKRVVALLSKIDLSTREEAECRDGLVQERLACFNIVSFTCQFVQEQFVFRLVPARIIIQEVRIAEDGAEKCRKLVRIVKERNKHP
ncbi:unnamed protein product [Toxocara canis]|uniref:TIR domain-containing protein n=1 Tax=Toxocara canis TaxID=6265 RepID=A0A183UFL0_TOXCA|nr:unnamed protein product [Toxocara canis]